MLARSAAEGPSAGTRKRKAASGSCRVGATAMSPSACSATTTISPVAPRPEVSLITRLISAAPICNTASPRYFPPASTGTAMNVAGKASGP